jgi:hypothetical protein
MGSNAAARRAGQRPNDLPTNAEKTNASATTSRRHGSLPAGGRSQRQIRWGNPAPDPGIEQSAIGTLQPYRQIRVGYE